MVCLQAEKLQYPNTVLKIQIISNFTQDELKVTRQNKKLNKDYLF